MTILSVARDVCLVIGLDQPDTFMGATDREYLELARVARDTAVMIASAFDWQKLQAIHTITGDGSSEEFAMPEDYDRMVETADMWSSRWIWSIMHVANPNDWLQMQVVPYTALTGQWIIYGGNFHFLPVMDATETVKFFYVSKNIVEDDAGNPKETFTDDADTYRLSEKLLELGMIWKWRENKGLPYDEKKADYDVKLGELMRRDAGSRSVVRGSARIGRGVRLAFPQSVGL